MFTLARTLGCTVAELGQRMSSRELSEWIIAERIQPAGEYRADLRTAFLAWIFALQAGIKRDDGEPIRAIDMLGMLHGEIDKVIEFDPKEAAEQDRQMLRLKLMKATAMSGGKIE